MWLKIWPVLRDLGCFGAGIWGVIHEELSGKTSIPLLAVYTALLGVPGTINALWLTKHASTASEPSPPPSSPSERPGRSSS